MTGMAGSRFRYVGFDIDRRAGRLTCRYSLGDRDFAERFTFGHGGDWTSPAIEAAATLVHLLAGVSYYKTGAPPVIDLDGIAVTETERRLLGSFYVDGLGEFAYRNGLDVSGLEIDAPSIEQRQPATWSPEADRPLVPFGGGIDSIVVAEAVRAGHPGTSLFVVNRRGDRFEAIERPAALTGLPIVRVEREIDPALLRSEELGFLNGHVPVTGILSAVAVMAAVLGGHDAIVMSNEWSASAATAHDAGRAINHQWSKGIDFEAGLRRVLASAFSPVPEYFSLLRPYSELWVARRFAGLQQYHGVFRSCNRSFHIEPSRRLDRWCGRCDKCCFIDLILSPFLDPEALAAVFDGREPLADPTLIDRFESLVGTGRTTKPFECVGEVGECRAALEMAACRPDRQGTATLQSLAAEIRASPGEGRTGGVTALFAQIGPHFIPDGYSPEDQLV